MGRGKRRPLFSLPPSHRALRALFFFLPSLPTTQKPPHNTKRPLRRRELLHTVIHLACLADVSVRFPEQRTRNESQSHFLALVPFLAPQPKIPYLGLPGGLLPYMGHIGMCRCEGYGFQAVYSRIGYINQSVWL